jgi:hypothetical protein
MEQTIEFAGKEARPVTTADASIPVNSNKLKQLVA